ncbi:MAG: hypothetical protein SNJ56_00020 [Termitinemataceae bacterium]
MIKREEWFRTESFLVVSVFIIILLLASCSASVRLQLLEDGKIQVRFSSSLSPAIGRLFRALSSDTVVSGASAAQQNAGTTHASKIDQTSGVSVIPASKLSRQLQQQPYFTGVRIQETKQDSYEGSFTILDSESFFKTYQCITLAKNTTSGQTQLVVQFSRTSVPQILQLLSPDILDYLDALMAPLVTGEALSVTDYLELVSSVYGPTVAGELAQSKLTVELVVSGPILSVSGGIKQGKSALFTIPLVDLLVLSKPLEYRILFQSSPGS